jgi:hypothetical protein
MLLHNKLRTYTELYSVRFSGQASSGFYIKAKAPISHLGTLMLFFLQINRGGYKDIFLGLRPKVTMQFKTALSEFRLMRILYFGCDAK